MWRLAHFKIIKLHKNIWNCDFFSLKMTHRFEQTFEVLPNFHSLIPTLLNQQMLLIKKKINSRSVSNCDIILI